MEYKRNPMKSYMQDIGNIPLVTRQEEVELANKIKNGDEKSRQELIKANLRLVVKIAHNFKGLGVPLLDLISEGNIGLMKAVERFDPEKGAKFSSYSAWWIKQGIRKALSEQSKSIRIPVVTVGKIKKIRNALTELTEELNRLPTIEEISIKTELSKRTIRGLRKANLKQLSFQDPTTQGEKNTFEELMSDTKNVSPAEYVAKKELKKYLKIEMYKCLDTREQKIISMRFGLDGRRPKSLDHVSQVIGRTRERVRQIQKSALKKLRRSLNKQKSKIKEEEILEEPYLTKEQERHQTARIYEETGQDIEKTARILNRMPQTVINHLLRVSYEKVDKGKYKLIPQDKDSTHEKSSQASSLELAILHALEPSPVSSKQSQQAYLVNK